VNEQKLDDRITVLRLTLDGLRPVEIAKHVGITPNSVRRIIRENPDVHTWARGSNGQING
jgi:hypothetical protein